MSFLSRYRYYATSVITLLTRFEKPGQILAIFLGLPNALPAEIGLRREGYHFQVREAMDVWVIKETCIDGDYLWKGPLQPGWNVVDIGAGLGDFTVLAAKHCHQGRVHAYEPLADSFELLKENLARNNAVANTQVFQEAVVFGGRPVSAVEHDGEAVSTQFTQEAGPDSVPSVDLAQLLERLPGSRCDFLKIDCEGCEFNLLLGSSPDILNRIDRLSLEIHEGYTPHTEAELSDFLSDNGFDVQIRPNPVHDYLAFLYAERPATPRNTL